jgi:hypothetical protein
LDLVKFTHSEIGFCGFVGFLDLDLVDFSWIVGFEMLIFFGFGS